MTSGARGKRVLKKSPSQLRKGDLSPIRIFFKCNWYSEIGWVTGIHLWGQWLLATLNELAPIPSLWPMTLRTRPLPRAVLRRDATA